ncbi:sugar phosphate isomerase/epimerase, partial [Candidatus Poribacteria bacterium]
MRNRVPIALQLYSVRDDCAGDLSLTLQAVAQMGYEGVEFAGYYDRTAEELRGMCDDLGLKVAGTHTGLNTLLGDELAETVAFNQTLGNPYLIVPGLSEEYRNSQQAWLDTAKIFNDIAEKIADQGMFTGYHNHTVEFETLEGKVPWDTFG